MTKLKKGLLSMMLLNTLNAFSQTTAEDKPVAWQLSATYKGDFASNFRGGISTGTTYLGLADLFLDFDTQKAGWWAGGVFLVHGANSHGGEPSANLIGDFQVASNIEAGNHTFLYELWFKQQFANVALTIGLQDLNVEFANSDVASLFLNSSFGVHSVIADNVAAPIFPLTSPGITLCWDASESVNLKTAFYKGCPIDFDSNEYNLNWNLNHLQGLLWVTESQFSWLSENDKTSILKTGVFFHQHCDDSHVINSESGDKLLYDYGFYVVGENQVYKEANDGQGLNVFYQMGLSPRNDNFGYIGAGCSYTGIFSKKGTDNLGLAMARGMLTNERGKDETTFELTYKAQLTDQIYLQPDFQYVVHPGGTDVQLKNAMAGLIRLGLEF